MSIRNVLLTIAASLPCIALSCAKPVANYAQPMASLHASYSENVRFGAVASINPIATDAAMDTLRNGGNAVDAAVRCMLTLGVVDGHNSGIGGGCFMLIRMRDGRVIALDGREMAPARATRDMFIRDGKADPALSQTGPLAVGVPGSLAVYDYAVRQFGRRSLADALWPAADLAERGFPINANYATKIGKTLADINRFDATRALLLKPDGSPLVEGDRLVQPDLAATYRMIARDGVDSFYKGAFARRVGQWMASHHGLITADDFAHYTIKQRQPIETDYHGFHVIGFPPPSSGGLHVAQILIMLERFDLTSLNDADRFTTIANAMNLAFADRAYWLGDPDFADVPRGLIDKNYLAGLGAKISPVNALVVETHGTPPNADQDFFEREAQKHTTHVSIADAEGNVASVTATVNTTFGSKVIVPGTGVFLNNQMDDFSAQPGVPNAFQLVGAEANAVGPGKRPLSSMSPTIVLHDGKPAIVIGAAGGPTIITQVVSVLTNLIDLKQSPEQAMASPRIHHQWRPDKLKIENTVDAGVRAELKRRGFDLDEIAPAGATNLVVIDGTSMTAVTEPRMQGGASAE